MVKPLVLGNWKMNGDILANAELLKALQAWNNESVDLGVCPPMIYLSQAQNILEESLISLGAQDVSAQGSGAYTGETSAAMLLEFGCRYALVGHSERRQYHGETDLMVAEKFKAAKLAGLTPVLCIGETQQEREASKTLEVVGRQLKAVVDLLGIEAMANTVVAYEPVWAIGTGLTASPEEAQEVHAFIRKQLASVAQKIQLLYGGSVKADNAEQLFAKQDIDGALVGGASLKAKDFMAIANAAVC